MAENDEPMIRAAVAAAQRHERKPETRWASVESHDALTGQLAIIVDGDDLATPAQDATGTVFAPGQRVLVLYSPPQACHVIGSRPVPPITYTPELDNVDVDDGTLEGEYLVHNGIVDFSVLIVLGTAGAVSGQIAIGLPILGASIITTEWLSLARATVGLGRYVGAGVYQPSTSDTQLVSIASVEGLWAAAVPDTWAPNDILRVTGRYPMRLLIENEDA